MSTVVYNLHAEPALRRLSRALTSEGNLSYRGSTDGASARPTPPKPPSPMPSDAAPTPLAGAPSTHQPHPHAARFLTATLPDAAGNTTIKQQSAAAWARELDMSPATLRWRLNRGWSDMECLGFVPHPRDRAAEQASSAVQHANVLVVETIMINNTPAQRIIPRPEVAKRLNIKQRSLVQRLRNYRSPTGSQTQVTLAELQEKSKNQTVEGEVGGNPPSEA